MKLLTLSRNTLRHFLEFVIFYFSLRKSRGKHQYSSRNLEHSLVIFGGRGMGPVWGQIWATILAHYPHRPNNLWVIDKSRVTIFNLYLRLVGARVITLSDLEQEVELSVAQSVGLQISESNVSLRNIRQISFLNIPVGEFALSTYCRHNATGDPTLDEDVCNEIQYWINRTAKLVLGVNKFFDKMPFRQAFATELFLEEYGALSFSAVNREIDVVRFAGTTRDDAFLVERVDKTTIRRHHAALAAPLTRHLQSSRYEKILKLLDDEVQSRYSNKWYRAKRNFATSETLDRSRARQLLGIQDNDTVVIVFSHILYDSLFFYGNDLFDTYSEWLRETVTAAIRNTRVKWFIKVHPSNMWRGELKSFLDGKYEEERIIESLSSALPAHVRLIAADNSWSPLTWISLADVGVTVRGTAGIEMAAQGKTVITAGMGRYEDGGFCIAPESKRAYLEQLRNLGPQSSIPDHLARNAQLYLFGLYCLRPFRLPGMVVSKAPLTKEVVASDDLFYIPKRIDCNTELTRVDALLQFLNDKRIKQLTEPCEFVDTIGTVTWV